MTRIELEITRSGIEKVIIREKRDQNIGSCPMKRKNMKKHEKSRENHEK